MKTVVTHSRQFHADELMAIALLKVYYFEESPKIIRTRDESDLEKYKKDPDVFVIDVGFEFNESLKNFDHHQKTFTDCWSDKTPLSSCGLIWRWLRENKYLHQHMNEIMMDTIEKEIIKKVDAHDNGVSIWRDASVLSGFNRDHHDDGVIFSQFKMALSVAKSIYINSFYHLKAKVKAEKNIFKAIKKSHDLKYNHTVVFESKLNDGVNVVSDNSPYHWVIIPRKKGSWKIQAVPLSSKKAFTQRSTPPSEWLGLSNEKLKSISGIDGLIYCHKNGFMLIFEGDLKDAILLTEGILR